MDKPVSTLSGGCVCFFSGVCVAFYEAFYVAFYVTYSDLPGIPCGISSDVLCEKYSDILFGIFSGLPCQIVLTVDARQTRL